ncbi:ABC transporter permease [Paenibacillus donghaensis]|uniref:ABC3 transporter permease C-terminal domain-containing protein n=1 Tax=Paenibacillus donghaensis TaxID=414771 RepID=A0A2Z2K9G2_9BACL|nr:FtsX-like permease family protein [Paenibacillus donghaensis]ASA19470.1 hypothetical protein B9T62_00540 [Paenibacillus donghaensis]
MIKSGMLWKMSLRHLALQKKQTLLSVLIGSIGSALIVSSFVFFSSFNYSGGAWLNAHFGNIQWVLVPPLEQSKFAPEQLDEISAQLAPYPLSILPYVSSSLTVSHNNGGEARVESNIIGLDFSFDEASDFEPDQPLWSEKLSDTEIVVSRPLAEHLAIEQGDRVQVSTGKDYTGTYEVKLIVEESGITGFRGEQQATGTIVFAESALQHQLSVEEDGYSKIWVGTNTDSDMFITSSDSFRVLDVRTEGLNLISGMKARYGVSFLFASCIAVIAGSLLLVQILFMLADNRQELYGVLRALGFSSSKIGIVFKSEAVLILSFSSLSGMLAGTAIGIILVKSVAGHYSETMKRYEGFSIPILPYFNLPGIILTGSLAMLFMLFIVLIVCHKIKKRRIIDMLYGSSKHEAVGKHPLILIVLAVFTLSILASGFIFGWVFEFLKPEDMGGVPLKALAIILLWLAASISAVYLSFLVLSRFSNFFSKLLIWFKLERSVVFLGTKYPQLNFKRSFTVALLFSVLFMALISTLIVSNQLITQSAVTQENQSLLGYSGYVPYSSDNERDRIYEILQEDSSQSEISEDPVSLESYKLNIDSQLLHSGGVLTLLSAQNEEEMSVRYGHLPLSSRLPSFKEDSEVWKALVQQDDVIVLDEKYALHPDEWSGIWSKAGLPHEPLMVGDEITLSILPKSKTISVLPEKTDDTTPKEVVDSRKVKIIGFVAAHADYSFYNLAIVPPAFFSAYKTEGFKWPNEQLGYVAFHLDNDNLEHIQALRTRFLLNNTNSFTVPAERNTVNQLMNKQMVSVFIAFMSLSLVIGIAGLALVQARAIQEREMQMKMLRYIGFRQKIIRKIFFVEGIFVGWTGLINGLLFGISGSYIMIRLVESYVKPTETLVPIKIPWLSVAGMSFALMVIVLAVSNLASKNVGRLFIHPQKGEEI